MAIEVELPDGSIAEFPDDTDDATIERVLAQQFKPQNAPAAPQQPSAPTQEQPRPDDSIARLEAAKAQAYAGSGTDQYGRQAGTAGIPAPVPLGQGGGGVTAEDFRAFVDRQRASYDPEASAAAVLSNRQQGFREANPILKAAAGFGSRIPTMAMGVGQMLGITDESDAAKQRERMRFMEGDTAASVGKVGGDIVATLLPASKVAQLPALGQRVAGMSALGGLLGASAPTVKGESRGLNATVGLVAGAGGELASKALGVGAKAIVASPQVQAIYQAAKARGINLTPAQLSDSKLLKYVADRMQMYPLSGGASGAAKQREAWNESLAGTIGEKAKALTPEVYATAKAKIGKTFEELTARNSMPLGPKVVDSLKSIADDAESYGDDATGKAVTNLIRRVTDQAKNGTLPGRAYQSIDSEIGKISKAGGEKGMYLGRVRDALRDAMDEGITRADKAVWQKARQQWRALKTVEPLVAKSDDGVLSPAALMGRVTANNAGKSSMASGTAGELGTLARIGQKIKPPPSSGTSERQLADSLFNPLNWPALGARTALGATVGRLPNSSALARLMMSSVPGQTLSALSRLAPSTGIAAGQLAAPAVAKERKRIK